MNRESQVSEVPTEAELAPLRELSRLYPNIDACLSNIASLQATLTLPKETIHVISDIHGEFKKLKHIINNASGSLRLLVDDALGNSVEEKEKNQLLNLIYYPRETYALLSEKFSSADERLGFLANALSLEFQILRELAKRFRLESVEAVFPEHYKGLFREALFAPQMQRSELYFRTIVEEFLVHKKELDLLRMTARVIRNLLISELVVAGDLGDRGPRIDRVIDFLMKQPNVAITWGNHDASWMGACLGHEACIATVLRVSLRYRRLSQLEEGYGITMAPLEKLARTVYGEDKAERFACKGEGLRDPQLMARMQKAIAIIQFKLEGQVVLRNKQFNLEHRNLLHRINAGEGSVTVDGKTYPLLDTNFPTIDWSDPYTLSPEEEACMSRMKESFLQSSVMWRHMLWVARQGYMYLRRDHALIFHACVPVDEKGDFLSFEVDGKPYAGRALFDALNLVVQRAFRKPSQKDLDMFWYLWSGPLSPWFGKDRMATFETYFIADKATHKETKNPYFKLIHDKQFCARVLREFDLDSDMGLIVNGHVPVKIEQGESPLKESGMAVTIDGAFSEAYGDKGFTLVLDPERTYLAQHHHFESVVEAITQGADIIPTIQDIRTFKNARLIADTDKGIEIRHRIGLLKTLVAAYESNHLTEEATS